VYLEVNSCGLFTLIFKHKFYIYIYIYIIIIIIIMKNFIIKFNIIILIDSE
jgi:hypothetical protein